MKNLRDADVSEASSVGEQGTVYMVMCVHNLNVVLQCEEGLMVTLMILSLMMISMKMLKRLWNPVRSVKHIVNNYINIMILSVQLL